MIAPSPYENSGKPVMGINIGSRYATVAVFNPTTLKAEIVRDLLDIENGRYLIPAVHEGNGTKISLEVNFNKLSGMAQLWKNEDIELAVVSVPQDFTNIQRDEIRQEGKSVGLEIIQILNEPAAAGVAYDLLFPDGPGAVGDEVVEEQFLVINIDEDILRVTLLLINDDGFFEVLGNTTSSLEQGSVEENVPQSINETLKLASASREVFIKNKSKIIFSGYSSYTNNSALGKVVKRFFFDENVMILDEIIPDQVNAIGAALWGSKISKEGRVEEEYYKKWSEDFIASPTTALPLGIETDGGFFSIIIPSKTSTPCKKTVFFAPETDSQTSAFIRVFEGFRPKNELGNRLLGFMELDEFPKGGAPYSPEIEITMEVDESGSILTVFAGHNRRKDIAVRKRFNLVRGRTEDDINRVFNEGLAARESDQVIFDVWKEAVHRLPPMKARSDL